MRLIHFLTCWAYWPIHRARTGQPYWIDDQTATMLGINIYGCRRCGHRSIEDRRERTVDPDCPVCSPETARRRQQARNRRQRGYSPPPRCSRHASLRNPPPGPGAGSPRPAADA